MAPALLGSALGVMSVYPAWVPALPGGGFGCPRPHVSDDYIVPQNTRLHRAGVDQIFVKYLRDVTAQHYNDAMDNEFHKWRAAMGLTQDQAAERLGVWARTVQAYEAGDFAPSKSVRKLMTAVAKGHSFEAWPMSEDHARGRRRKESHR